jgi:hypothetical protein
MGVRTTIATSALGAARSFGRTLGCELEVTVDNQRIQTVMRPPGSHSGRVWDPDMYYRGNLYLRGYANPVKPRVDVDLNPSELDRGELDVSEETPTREDATATDGGETMPTVDAPHARLMSSKLFKKHMDNHMISELVTPDEKWNKIFMAILVLGGVIVAFGVLAVLLATGAI